MTSGYTHIRHSALQLIKDGVVFWTSGTGGGNAPMVVVNRPVAVRINHAASAFVREGRAEVTGDVGEHRQSGQWGPAPLVGLTVSGVRLLEEWDYDHGPAI